MDGFQAGSYKGSGKACGGCFETIELNHKMAFHVLIALSDRVSHMHNRVFSSLDCINRDNARDLSGVPGLHLINGISMAYSYMSRCDTGSYIWRW